MPSPVAKSSLNWGSITCQMSAQTSRAGAPSAAGCLGPGIGAQASLYKSRSSGPQYIAVGKAECRQMLSADRRDWGHVPGGPKGCVDQSCSRIIRAISLPPARKLS